MPIGSSSPDTRSIVKALQKEDYYITLMNAESAAVSNNFSTPFLPGGLIHGNIQASTSSTFVGTTATLALQASNDGTTWSTVYQDDGTTPVSFTLAASSIYNALLKRLLYRSYRLVYTKGDASAGTITATFLAKR